MPITDKPEDVTFSYFVIRLRGDRTTAAPDLSGIVERIGSGDKHAFSTSAELVELLGTLARGAAA